jgi:nitrate reductase NapAB chaperone NapD
MKNLGTMIDRMASGLDAYVETSEASKKRAIDCVKRKLVSLDLVESVKVEDDDYGHFIVEVSFSYGDGGALSEQVSQMIHHRGISDGYNDPSGKAVVVLSGVRSDKIGL